MPRKISIKDLPKELRPFAEIITPALALMLDRDGGESVMRFLFGYKKTNRSWERKLQRSMTIGQRCEWRQAMSDERIKLLDEVRVLRMTGTALRRAVVQRVMNELLLLVVKAL